MRTFFQKFTLKKNLDIYSLRKDVPLFHSFDSILKSGCEVQLGLLALFRAIECRLPSETPGTRK